MNTVATILIVIMTTGLLAGQVTEQKTIQDILSSDATSREAARAALPGLPSDAIDLLLSLLTGANPQTSGQVMLGIEHFAAGRTSTEDHAMIIRALLTWCAEHQTEPAARRGRLIRLAGLHTRSLDEILRLCGFAADNGLIDDVLFALGLVQGPRGDAGLLHLLDWGRATRQPAVLSRVLDTLAERPADHTEEVMDLADLSGSEVDLAARRVLTNGHSLSAVPVLVTAADRDLPGAAADLAKFLESGVHARTSDREAWLYLLRSLRRHPSHFVRLAVYDGLARLGDHETALFIDGLRDRDEDVRSLCRRLLSANPSDTLRAALRDVVEDDTLDAWFRACVLPAFVAITPEEGPQHLTLAARSPSLHLRRVAADIWGEVGPLNTPGPLAELLNDESTDVRQSAARALTRAAERGVLNNELHAAWIPLLPAALKAAETPASRSKLLRWIGDFGPPDSGGLLAGIMDLPAESAWAEVRLMERHPPSDRSEFNQRLISALSRLSRRQQRAAVYATLEKNGVNLREVLVSEGFLVDWHLLGPLEHPGNTEFKTPPFPLENLDVTRPFTENGSTLAWKPLSLTSPDGLIDFRKHFDRQEKVAAALWTKIESADTSPRLLKLGSDDGVNIWWNGELVWSNNTARGYTLDEDTVRLTPRIGLNELLVVVYQGNGGWEAGVRLVPEPE